jgi:hypothetical protein
MAAFMGDRDGAAQHRSGPALPALAGFLLGTTAMKTDESDLETHVDLAAAAVGLTIAPDHRPGVIVNLRRTAEVARLVTEFPIPDTVEAAPVFRP